MLLFVGGGGGGGGKMENPEKNTQSKTTTNNKLNSLMSFKQESNLGHIGVRQVLSSVHHSCS